MTVFLTSSPTGPLDNSRSVDGLDSKNGFLENLRSRWPENARVLYITATPTEFRQNDWICEGMMGVFQQQGMTISVFDIWDDRRDFSPEELCSYHVLILGGGHVPTQNAFFHRICLREKMSDFCGIVMGISAGTMNCAGRVYAQPEMPGEATDPAYVRFLPGLGLTDINILPHYQMVKDFYLDGMGLFEDITYGDSYGQSFLALPDGSYVLIEDGKPLLFGEAYRIADGKTEQICHDNQVTEI